LTEVTTRKIGDNRYRITTKYTDSNGKTVTSDGNYKVVGSQSLTAAKESIVEMMIRQNLNLKPSQHVVKIEDSKENNSTR
jgi:hypothetical protein